MKAFPSYARPTESETLGLSLAKCIYNKSSVWLLAMLKLKNPWVQVTYGPVDLTNGKLKWEFQCNVCFHIRCWCYLPCELQRCCKNHSISLGMRWNICGGRAEFSERKSWRRRSLPNVHQADLGDQVNIKGRFPVGSPPCSHEFQSLVGELRKAKLAQTLILLFFEPHVFWNWTIIFNKEIYIY